MSSIRDGQKPRAEWAPKPDQRRMAHHSPKVAESRRLMAHPLNPVVAPAPVARGPLGALGAAIAGLQDRLIPRGQRRRELAAVLALILVATAVTASLPGGWAESSSSPSSSNAALAAASSSYDWMSDYIPGTIPPVGTAYVKPTGPAPRLTPTLPPSPKPTPKPGRVYTFVAMGDSLTAWPSDYPWPSRLDTIDSRVQLINNAGVPGEVTAEMRARFASDVIAQKPAIVFILGGTNDIGHNVSQATTIANLKAMVIAAKAAKIRPFLILLPPTNYTGSISTIDALNAAIQHLGNAYGVVVIDIHTQLSKPTGVYWPKYTSDGLHFSNLGAQTVAGLIYNRIRRLGY